MKKIKKMLALLIMLGVIISSGLVFTGCKKKTTDNVETTTKTTQKEKTFEDYWIFVEGENTTSKIAYENISLSTKEKGKNNINNYKNYCVELKAREDIKINSISYTFTNDSTVSTQFFDQSNNRYRYDKDNKITYLLLKTNSNDYLKDIESGESVNKTISYDNLIIKKGEDLYITAPNNISTNNENWFFYNFKINFEEIKS